MANIPFFEGSFGFITKAVRPPGDGEKNDNVMKVFGKRNSMNALLQRTKNLSRIMGENEGHRMQRYRPSITYTEIERDAPQTASKIIDNLLKYEPDYATLNNAEKLQRRNEIIAELKTVRYKRSSNGTEIKLQPYLPILRMPNNGIDLYTLQPGKTYYCPIPAFLFQIEKLLSQTKSLFENGYIHVDIRNLNVMINIDIEQYRQQDEIQLEHPRLTIIDFDFLQKIKHYMHMHCDMFRFYNKPPESLLMTGWPTCVDATPEYMQRTKNNYIREIYTAYILFWRNHLGIEPEQFPAYFYEKLTQNHKDMTSTNEPGYDYGRDTLPMIDNFGLAYPLLHAIFCIYPATIDPSTSDPALQPVRDTIALLKDMADLHYKKRPYPDEAFDRMKAICDPLREARGGRRKTIQRHQRRQRRKTRRASKN